MSAPDDSHSTPDRLDLLTVELETLLGVLCDGELNAVQSQRLEQLILENPAARTYYVRHMELHAGLIRQVARAPRPSRLGFIHNVIGSILGMPLDARSMGVLGVMFILGASCSALVLGGWLRLHAVRPLPATATAGLGGAANQAPSQPFAEECAALATLTSSSNCRWEMNGGGISSGQRLSNAEILLSSGCAEVAFDDGARVLIEGPCRFVPLSHRSILLRSGRVVVKAPRCGSPFAVLTNVLTASSMEGEFGVSCQETLASQVHVFTGNAEVAAYRGGRLDGSEHLLEAGEALRADLASAPDLASVSFDSATFVRRVPVRQTQLPSALVSYWNFDELGGPAFDSKGLNTGVLQGVSRTAGIVGRGAVKFSGAAGEAVMVGGTGAFEFSGGATIEAVMVPKWNGSFGTWSEIFRHENGDQRVLLSFQNDDDNNGFGNPGGYEGPVLAFGLNVGGKYEELEVRLDGQDHRPTVAELTDGKPHHVVGTYDSASGQKCIYLDGRLLAELAYPPGSAIRSGGDRLAMVGSNNGTCENFDGTLDEIAIYRAAIDAATAEAHWNAIRAGRGYFDVSPPPTEDSSGGI